MFTKELHPELSDAQITWVMNYYDIPLEGLVRCGGKEYWFIIAAGGHWNTDGCTPACDDVENCGHEFWEDAIYSVHQLTDSEMAREKECHCDFQRWVGTHWDYEDNKRPGVTAERRPAELSTLFYTKWPPDYDKSSVYRDRPIVGWFKD